MAFNVKVIEYPNGNIQVRYYSEPMRENFEKPIQHEKYVIEPFENTRVVVTKFETKEEIAKREDYNRYRSAVRSKNMVYTYARCYNWEWFITLTISPDSMDRFYYKLCSEKIRKWLNNQKNRFAPDLKYLIVPEQHKNGAWHFHGLLSDTGLMKFVDSGHKVGKDTVYNLDKYKYGFTTATKVKDTSRVSKYIGKYITKEMCNNAKGSMRYFVSRNIPMPTEKTVVVESGEIIDFVNMLAESTGTNLCYISPKTENCYINCQYYELQ